MWKPQQQEPRVLKFLLTSSRLTLMILTRGDGGGNDTILTRGDGGGSDTILTSADGGE